MIIIIDTVSIDRPALELSYSYRRHERRMRKKETPASVISRESESSIPLRPEVFFFFLFFSSRC